MAFDPHAQYKDLAITTATPGGLIVMLFEGAVKNINIAARAIEENDIQLAHDSLVKTQDIYSALIGSLNNDLPISAQLKNLYTYIIERLAEANIKKDASILTELLEFTHDFRDTWKEVEKRMQMALSGK